MHNNSIETLLLRHYGATAPAPVGLEQQLSASVQPQVEEQCWQQSVASRIREGRVSRRHVVRWVTMASAGAGALSIALEGLRSLESSLGSRDTLQSVYSS
jgi:hypothetical protein